MSEIVGRISIQILRNDTNGAWRYEVRHGTVSRVCESVSEMIDCVRTTTKDVRYSKLIRKQGGSA